MTVWHRARHMGQRLWIILYFLAALLLGGASLEGQAGKTMLITLSCLSALLILITARSASSQTLFYIGAAFLACCGLALFYIVPLPKGLWADLPDRAIIEEGAKLLSEPIHSTSLSFAPEISLLSVLAFMVPLGGFMLIGLIKWRRGAETLKWTVIAAACLSSLLGFAQLMLPETSAPYFYEFTNRGSPVGSFSNANHQASFLNMCLPFLAAAGARLRLDWQGGDDESAASLMLGLAALIIIAAIFAAGSAAGYLLFAPVALLSLLLFFGASGSGSGRRLTLILILGIAGFAGFIIFTSPVLEGLGKTSLDGGPLSRMGSWDISFAILSEHWLWGTGPGTFEQIYHLYEDPTTVTRNYVAHAHNDYLEWWIETGLIGLLLLIGLLVVWGRAFVRIWTQPLSQSGVRLKRAASIATLVPLFHSLVDYPLRTPAIACFAAMCLALMVLPKYTVQAPERAEAEEDRHLTL